MLSAIVTALTYVGNWLVFQKLGLEGWKCLIPFYCSYVFYKELYGNGWRMLLLLVPLVNVYIFIKFNLDLAKRFGQPPAFGVGLILMNSVFMCILGFGDAQDTQQLF